MLRKPHLMPDQPHPMPGQPHLIARAAEFLTTEKGPPKEKLILGGKLLWAARTFSADWTPKLLERVNNIYRGLLKDGIFQKTVVEKMDENTVKKCLKQLTKDTVELAAEIEQAMSQGRLHK
jgi:hypothetical protein